MSASTRSSDGTKGPVDIRGIKVQDRSKPPVRKELRDMKANKKEWTLLLLGMERFQETKENLPLSYFQIAGIHGRPYTKWPEQDWNHQQSVDLEKQVKKGTNLVPQWGGYCTHTSILFLPWHRPYLALFEEALYTHVNAIAELYDETEGKSEYVELAKNFRLPYWDWALPGQNNASLFPAECLRDERHDGYVIRPAAQGRPGKLDYNPIGTYRFSKEGTGIANGKINLDKTSNATIRWSGLDTKSGEAGQSQAFGEYFFQKPGTKWGQWAGKGKNLTERTLFILEAYDGFGKMSYNGFRENKEDFENYGSLEDAHNSLHVIVGGFLKGHQGHMSDTQTAAFDPIFWLHHCNIDRLWAIWQALHDDAKNPAAGVSRQPSTEGTYTIDLESYEDKDTDLTPFTNTEDVNNVTFWRSDGVRDTREFGYVYPETQQWKYRTKADVMKAVRDKYKMGSLANFFRGNASEAIGGLERRAKFQRQVATLTTVDTAAIIDEELHQNTTPVLMDPEAIAQVELPAGRPLRNLLSPNRQYLEWLVNIKAEKHSLGGNFVIHVFLGAPGDSTPELYLADPSHVALFSSFGTSDNSPCEKCHEGQAAGLQVTGQIPLTMALVERYLASELDSLRPEHVVPYLQTNLHWRMTGADGARGHRADVGNLLVAVVSNEVTVPDDPDRPVLYAPTVEVHPEATTKREGGGRGAGTGYTGTNFVAPVLA